MSAISLKSITGITSITTPAGVDNVFTVHTNDTTERFRIDQTGNQNIVGIVTVTKDLDVDGQTSLDHTTIAGIVTFQSGSGLDLATHNRTAGMRIINNGNPSSDGMYIGYGNANNGATRLFGGGLTSNPTVINSTGVSIPNDLDVDGHTNLDNVSIVGVATVTGNIIATGAVDAAGMTIAASVPVLNFNDTNNNPDFRFLVNSNSFILEDTTNSQTRLTVGATGNISINNDLDVDGHTNLDNVSIAGVSTFSGLVNVNGNASQSAYTPLLLQNSAAAGTGSNPDVVKIAFGSNGVTKGSIRAAVYGEGHMTFHTNNDTEKVRIAADGKFGIGDFSSGTALSQALHVKGSEPKIFLEHTGGYDMTLTTSDGAGNNGITVSGGALSLAYDNKNIWMCRTGGYVAIGHMSPATILHVKANVGDLLRLDRNNTGAVGNQIAFRHSNSGTLTETGSINCVSTANAATGELRFYTKASGASNSEKLRITSGGNVNIGNGSDTPYAPLHVYAENNRGLNAIFGKGFVDHANYHYDDANIQLNGRDVDGNDTGAGIEFNTRNTAGTNWLHGAITQDRNGNFIFKTGGAGVAVGVERLKIAADGKSTFTQEVSITNTVPSMKFIDSANSQYAFIDGNSGNLTLHSDKGASGSSSYMKFAIDNVVKMTLDHNGHLDLATGNLQFANGAGLDFSNVPASGNTLTSDGNKLDDYEEGTYTPTATTGAGGNITSTTSFLLRYVKVGRLVHIVGRLHFATSANNLSSFSLSLPFTNSTGNQHDTSVCTHVIRGNGGDPVQGIRIFRIGPGSTTMYMNNHEGQSIGDLGTTSPHININFSYFAA